MAALPMSGETLYGFTVSQLETIPMMDAKTVEFYHSFSGARLLYIQTEDKELGFSLIYRTPQMDECDCNHILEHLLLCSCKQYPSRDIFFDMDSKSYSTFMNGVTDNAYTCYPLCSQSENQLIKLADVLLCCMEEPEALSDERFFLREGIRLEYDELSGELSLNGTVLSEDWGHLTDLPENADSAMAQALYRGQTAANLLGRAHLHYKELTFDKVKEAFSRYYDYSNCLIILYGDMDYRRVLKFLDREHLSRHKSRNLNLLPFFKEPVTAGFFEASAQSPAYKGSEEKQESLIDYSIDLTGFTEEELIYWELIAGMLDQETSVWHTFAKEEGFNQVMEAYLDTACLKPSLKFRLYNADPEQKDGFLRSIKKALSHISLYGVTPELFSASIKENRMSDCLAKEASHQGFNLSEEIGRYWSQTGKTDYFPLYERAFQRFSEDNEQVILKILAKRVLTPKLSALVVTTPKPGLAETLEQEKQFFLKKLEQSMTAKERNFLKQRSEDFRRWSSEELSNMDFLILPEELPEPEEEPPITEKAVSGITFFSSPVKTDAIGSYQIFFDISRILPEDWNYLTLYQMLLTELPTSRFSVKQQKNMEQEYLHDCMFDELYPPKEAGKHSHPMMSVFWYGLTEDFETSLDFLLDIMGNADYSDRETIIRVLEKYLPDYDLSKGDNAPSLASSLTEGYIRQDSRYRYLLNSPQVYPFLKEMQKKLSENTTGAEHFAKKVSEKLRLIASCILNRNRLVFLSTAREDALDHIEQTALAFFSRLSSFAETDEASQEARSGEHCPETALVLPPQKKRTAVCMESPLQEIHLVGDFKNAPEFKGRYLPYLLALGDKYLKPMIRYQGRAYDCGVDFLLPNGFFTMWSTADPDVASTIQCFLNAGEALFTLDISEEELKGYILNTYAQALPPSGALNNRMRYLRRRMIGIDTNTLNEMIADIKNSTLADQKSAAKLFTRLIADAPICAAGNESSLLSEKELFDEVINLREK